MRRNLLGWVLIITGLLGVPSAIVLAFCHVVGSDVRPAQILIPVVLCILGASKLSRWPHWPRTLRAIGVGFCALSVLAILVLGFGYHPRFAGSTMLEKWQDILKGYGFVLVAGLLLLANERVVLTGGLLLISGLFVVLTVKALIFWQFTANDDTSGSAMTIRLEQAPRKKVPESPRLIESPAVRQVEEARKRMSDLPDLLSHASAAHQFKVLAVDDNLTLSIESGSSPGTLYVRLVGIQVMPDRQAKARRFVQDTLVGHGVRLEPTTIGTDTTDRFGNLLAYVWMNDGRMVNAELIRNGLASLDLRYDHPRKAEFESMSKASARREL